MFPRKYLPFVAGATILMTVQPILTTLTKVDGHYQYVQISTTLLAELTKLLLSAAFYAAQSQHTHGTITLQQLVNFSVPAAIYFINNNLIFVILQYVNSTTYQILSALKTVFTGILFRIVLKKRLSDVQMISIVLLSCGTATSQIGTTACDKEGAASSSIGVAAAVLTCFLSALGGVYSERLMKHDAKAHSIHLQNFLLYAWGVLFNLLAMLGGDGARVLRGGLLQGYTSLVWLLVLNNAFNGLAISAILKYTDNIVRVFAHAAAMMLTMGLEIFLFGASPTPQLLISATVVACAVYLYNRVVPAAPSAPPTSPAKGESGGAAGIAPAGAGGERQPLLTGDEDEVELPPLPPLLPMLMRGKDGYSIRTTRYD